MLRHAPVSGYIYPEETQCYMPTTRRHTCSPMPLLWGDFSKDRLVYTPALQCTCAVCLNTCA